MIGSIGEAMPERQPFLADQTLQGGRFNPPLVPHDPLLDRIDKEVCAIYNMLNCIVSSGSAVFPCLLA